MKEIPKIPKEDAEYFLDLHEKLKECDFNTIDIEKLGIEKITMIAEKTFAPVIHIKYCNGTEERVQGVENIMNKIKELNK
jgi:hypothetical protein